MHFQGKKFGVLLSKLLLIFIFYLAREFSPHFALLVFNTEWGLSGTSVLNFVLPKVT